MKIYKIYKIHKIKDKWKLKAVTSYTTKNSHLEGTG